MDSFKNQHMIILDSLVYKLESYDKMLPEFQKLMQFPEQQLIAVAKYGGPIATIKNKEVRIIGRKYETKLERDYIYFFDSQGKLFTKMWFVYTKIIVCFEFLQNEYLLIVLEDGQYQIIDPFLGKFSNDTRKMLSLHLNKAKIVEAKVYDNSFVFYTELMQFFYVPKLEQQKFYNFQDFGLSTLISQMQISNQKEGESGQKDNISNNENFHLNFIVVPPREEFSFSGRIEVHITHPDTGIIVLIGDEGIRIDYAPELTPQIAGKAIIIKGRPSKKILIKVKMICQSPNGSKFAYLTESRILICSKNYFDEETTSIENKMIKFEDKNGFQILKQFLWCSESCVVLVYEKHFLMVGMSNVIKRKLNHGFGLAECDGIRFVTMKNTVTLRNVTREYHNIFKYQSIEPGANLLDYYKSLVDKQPIPQDFREYSKENIAKAVQQCLGAAIFEQNEGVQK